MSTQNTVYKPASLGEVWSVSYPMILALASGYLMFFIDRLMVAQYSTDAMTAVASAGMAAAMFQYAAVTVVSIVEVFVGQSNGSKKYFEAPQYVWQMIWCAFASFIVYIPLALNADFFVADPYDGHGSPYFFWIVLCAPLWLVHAALASFFIGITKTKYVTYAALLSNGLNIVLDYMLIFGIEGVLEPMGTTGAAIATIISVLMQGVFLLCIFLKTDLRKKYKTHILSFDFSKIKKVFKVGFPPGVGHFFEIGAWAVMLHLMAMTSKSHVTVMAIGQSIFIVLLFLFEGLSKGATALASNYIGDGNVKLIPKMLRSFTLLHVIFVGIVAAVFYFYGGLFIEGFIDDDLSPALYAEVYQYAKISLIWVAVFVAFDGFAWVFAGVLTSGGDTKFVMFGNAISVWVFGILPLYLLVTKNVGGFNLGPDAAWMVVALYAIINTFIFYARFRQGKWVKMDMSKTPAPQQ